jgi:uncharacterized membrane protein
MMHFPDIEWLHLVVRWMHLIFGIAWIGSSFYFVWQDNSLEPASEDPDHALLGGQIWMVHGGGFYNVRKYKSAPQKLPDHLHWFMWEAYSTWLSGMALLALVYWVEATSYMLPQGSPLMPWQAITIAAASLGLFWIIYDRLCRSFLANKEGYLALSILLLITALSFFLSQIFTGRAMFIHVGAALATTMVANVFRVIIPNQRKVVAAMIAQDIPDPRYGLEAKLRSVHNTYLTLPVLFLMISNHYPLAFSGSYNWLKLLLICLVAAAIRRVFILRHKKDHKYWMLPILALLFILIAFWSSPHQNRKLDKIASSNENAIPMALIQTIVQLRCQPCHAEHPSMEGYDAPPQGVIFETDEQIRSHASMIEKMVVLSDAMPLGNVTHITQEERNLLGRWIEDDRHLKP